MKGKVSFYPYRQASDHLFSGRSYALAAVDDALWNVSYPVDLTGIGVEVFWWMINNTKAGEEVLHETEGDKLHEDANKFEPCRNRFYFTDSQQAERFRSELHLLPKPKSLFPLVGACDSEKLAGFCRIDLGQPFSKSEIAFNFWCRRNAIGIVYREAEIVVFEKPEDMVLTKLKFNDSMLGEDLDLLMFGNEKSPIL